ncbi:MAG: TPM domain-containing protein [Polyangiaceae bacterium]|nr:TPM domain-containing protein [Polyangiaceae bacterium]
MRLLVLVRTLAWAIAVLCSLRATAALAAFTPPVFAGHPLVDAAGKLSADDVLAIEQRLDAIERATHHEIVVFLPASLEGGTIEDVAYLTFNAWHLGKKGADDGVLLVIAPAERKVRIETGKGVGGALTDLQSSYVIRDRIAPELKSDHFRAAILGGIEGIDSALKKGLPASPAAPRRGAKADDGSRIAIILGGFTGLGLLIIVVGGILARRGGKGGTASRDGGAGDYGGSDYGGSDYGGSGGSSDGGGSFGGGGESGGGGASGDY